MVEWLAEPEPDELADHPVRHAEHIGGDGLSTGQLRLDLGEVLVVVVDVLGVVDRDAGLLGELLQGRRIGRPVLGHVDIERPVRPVDGLVGVGRVRHGLIVGHLDARHAARAEHRSGPDKSGAPEERPSTEPAASIHDRCAVRRRSTPWPDVGQAPCQISELRSRAPSPTRPDEARIPWTCSERLCTRHYVYRSVPPIWQGFPRFNFVSTTDRLAKSRCRCDHRSRVPAQR